MAKKAKKPAKTEEPFFIGIKDPIGMRRAILESSKDVIQSLQRFEKFTGTRKKKREHVEKLKVTVKEAVGLIKRLKKGLPSSGLRMKSAAPKPKPIPVEPKKVVKKESKPEVKQPVMKPKHMGELEKLESELSDIESKLGSLT
ncbi:hypothetical protein ACFLYT_01390 [Nanoarchaeota archaeon]